MHFLHLRNSFSKSFFIQNKIIYMENKYPLTEREKFATSKFKLQDINTSVSLQRSLWRHIRKRSDGNIVFKYK